MKRLPIVTFAERPDLRDAVGRLHGEAWPPFQSKGAAVQRYWCDVYVEPNIWVLHRLPNEAADSPG